MRLFDRWKQPDIDAGVAQFAQTPGAVLLDVRTRQEFAQGSIPGSRNLPLQELATAPERIAKDTPLFIYCLSGARSRRAVAALQRMGFTSVVDLGGICNYHGKVAVQG